MNEKTAAYSSLLAAVEALAEECAHERIKRGGGEGEISEDEIASIAAQMGRPLTPTEITAIKLTFASTLAR